MATSAINRYSKIATDPLRSFRFYAEFTATEGTALAANNKAVTSFTTGFTQINGLAINTQSIGYREGGYNTTLHQVPGMTTFSPVTFQRGTLYGENQGITMMRSLFAASAGDGLKVASGGPSFRYNIDVWVLDHPIADQGNNSFKMRFRIHNAWITSLNYSDLNATDNQILFETMQFVHEGLSVSFTDAAGAPSTGEAKGQ
jgi:phage tail-like protein